jgi:peroxiredoxin
VRIHSSDGLGAVVIFLSTVCPHCAAFADALAAVEGTIRRDVFVICQGDSSSVAQFAADHALAATVLVDATGQAGRVYQVQAVPAACVLNASGEVVEQRRGLQAVHALLRSSE